MASKTFRDDLVDNGNCFQVHTGDRAGTAGTHVARLLLRNPINSSKFMRILFFNEGCFTSTGNVIYRYFRNPQINSNGTSMTAESKIIGNSRQSSKMTAFSDPVVAANGTLIDSSIASQMSVNRNDGGGSYVYILEPGADLLVTVRTNAAATTWGIGCHWSESNN